MKKKDLEKEFKELLIQVRSYSDEGDIEKIKSAWEFAKLAHTGQKRKTGDPYASHLLETARALAIWKLDTTSIIAGFLHDAIEEGGAKREDIVSKFGEDVAVLVDGVTKVSDLKLRGCRNEKFVENLRKMFLAMAKDLRVVLVKLADRLHNMETLSALPPEKQERIARETLEVFSPLAERLGMGELKSQLDDLAFPYVYPKEYRKLTSESAAHYRKAEQCIKKMKRTLLRKLAEEGVKAKTGGRKKHLYSLWTKLERPEISWDFEKIQDIIALRILVDTIPQCYTALGVVHGLYKPVPYIGISDFIAQPKPNGYRSIHTKVFGQGDRIVEVQIRTHDMHKQAEYGIAAHWHLAILKAKGRLFSKDIDAGKFAVSKEKLAWVKQLAVWQKEFTDSKEFLKAVKFDALKHRNFVFSPKGDIYDLPTGATPVDFAYAVHTDLGNYIKGAKVDGEIVPLHYQLKSGEVVEIIKSKSPKKTNHSWLDFVVTTIARRKINQSLRKES